MSNPEQTRCINPKCKEPLFTPAAKMCHKCFTIQQQLPEQQQTAPSGPGPPTSQLPSIDRQSGTHTDPSQHAHPPPSGPGTQYSGSQQGNRDGSGSVSGDTNKEQFFDAQSVLPQTARAYHHEGHPPSSQPNIPQTYQYPQVFGMYQHPRGPGAQGTPVPPFTHGSQPPYYPPPPRIQLPQGGQWVWSPAYQQLIFIPHRYIGTEHPGFSPQASSQMVHGQISPQGMPSPQPHTSQPQSPRGMPSPQPPTSQSQLQSPRGISSPQPPTSQSQPQSPRGMASPQPPTSQSQPQSPRGMPSPQPPTSQSQPQSPRGIPSPQPPTSQSQPQSPRGMPSPQPPTSQSQPQSPRGMPSPQPPTSQSQLLSSAGNSYNQPNPSQPNLSQPQLPSSTVIVSPQSHSSQSQPSGMPSPQLRTSQPPLEAYPAQPSPSLQPQSPSGGAPLHQQSTGATPPSVSAQSSQELGTSLSQGLETDSQMQVSTTSSKLKSPVSPKPESFPPPSSHPSAASLATSSTDKFQAADPQTQKEQDKHFSEHNGTSKGTNSGKVPDKDSNSGQSSTQPQPTNTQPKTNTSFTDTSSHPLQGTSDSHKKSGEQGSDANNKGPRKRSTDSDDSENIPAKLAKQEEGTKKEHNKEPSNDKDAKGGTSEQPSEEPTKDKQPEKPVSQHAGDSQTGSATSAAVTKEHGAELVPYRKLDEPEVLFSGKDKNKKEKKNKKDKEQESGKTSAHGLEDMPMPQGLQAPPEKSTAVTFHAIVPLLFWEWEDANSHMHIRFDRFALGQWRYNCGKMTKQRAIGDGWYEMTCTLSIDAEILKHPVAYKYVVYSPKMENKDDCYEYLHGYGGNPNRCLRIPKSKLSKTYGGAYHQYDTVVYPKKTKISKSFLESVKETGIVSAIGGKISGWFGRSSTPQGDAAKETDFKPLPLQQMGELCLKAYLAKNEENLCSGDFFSIPLTVEYINHIFESLYHRVIIHQKAYLPSDKDLDGSFKETLKGWLESNVESLQGGSAESPQKRLASAVLIAYCIKKASISIAHLKIDDFTIPLLRMLCLRPDLEKQQCQDFAYLCEVLPKDYWKETAQAIAVLCSRLKQKPQNVEWLLALPLYHFLKGSCEPFGKPEMNPEKIGWGQEEDLNVWEIRSKVHSSKEGLIQEYFEKCEHLFALDPLLLRVVICICPNKDLDYLFERIPPFLSTTWLANRAWYIRAMNKDEAQEWISWLEHIKKLSVRKMKEGESEMHEKHLVSTVNAALLLYRRLTTILKSCSQHYVAVLKASLSLILFAVAQLKICPSEEKDEIIKEAFARLKGILWEWIVDRKVIGGSVFGGSLPSYYFSGGWKAKEELELWQSLLTLEYPPDQQVIEEWHNIAITHIQKRMNQVPDTCKFDLVRLLEDCEDLHTILSDSLMEIGTKAIDNIFSKPAKFAEQDFTKLATTESARVGSLLGKLLKKMYPDLHPDTTNVTISFDDLLHWHLWPQFIRLYGSKSKLKEGLPQECQIACLCALSGFQVVCDDMQKRSISVTELQKIKDNHEQMKRLCEAATAHGDSKESGQLSYKAVNNALSQIMEEFKVFEEHQSHLSHLCSNIPDVVQGLSQLKRELNKDFRREKINKLCVREATKIRVLCFQSAGSLSDFADNFCLMSQKYPSDLFTVEWTEAAKAAVRNSTSASLTVADIHPKVWEPAFRNCQTLLDELHDRSMKLVRVDGSFKRHGSDLEMQLMNLFAGVNACLGERRSGAWIIGVVQCIHDYWHLCNYQKAASAFLDLKDALNLKGDFRNVEKLATKVTTSMKNQTLASVDENLIKTGKFLEDISSNRKKLDCLACFAQCQEVIIWLRDVTKDVSDLQNFVNVALATAAGGEDDLAHDQLSNLRTVGSGFGALIYNLPKNTGYADLAKRCESLWEALQNYQDLPNKLVHCDKQLEWYKSVKETQGSVEVTSFGKMNNILRYGRYRVGAKSTQTVHSIHDMIHLKLENTRKQLPQNNFSLDDLRDLESKLVLITGSKAENRREVDQFLNTLHSVCRIAEVLLALQQKGNVKYTGWTLNFHCAVDMVDTLQEQAKDMEEELQTWEEEVRQARKEYYELNYYTTLQLLTLRQELGKLKISEQPRTHTQVNPHVLALLESISTEIISPYVWDVVKSVTAEQQPQGGVGASVFTAQQHTSAEMLPASTVGPSSQAFPRDQPVQPSLADDILGAADMQTSASASRTRLPQPKLTHNELSEKQKQMFDDFMNCNYPEQLILVALEKFGEDRFEADNWIVDNAGQYGSSDDEGGETDIEEEEESEADSELEDTLPQATSLPSPIATGTSAPHKPKEKEPSTPSLDRSPRVEIHVTQKQPVDEYHPTVQQLLEAGYDVEQSIEAVEHHDSLERAMDYLLNLEGDGEIFHRSTLDEGHQYPEEKEMEFVEESQEERAIGNTTLTVLRDERAEERYLMLPELGKVLQELRKALPAAVPSPRQFPADVLELGAPNLLVTAPENVLKMALALYMDGGGVALPLPIHEEVLVCNQATTTEEVTLLWQRAIGDPGFRRIFCLLHAEKLSYQVSDQALRSLTELSQGLKQDYRLVIICSNEDEDKSHIISRLNAHRKHFTTLHDFGKFREYLKTHFTGAAMPTHQSIVTQGVSASMVDCGNSCVRVVSSTRSGMGKSLFITRMADKLTEYTSMDARHVTIPIHGPEVTPDTVMEFLKDHMKRATSTIFHFDIAPTILWKVDTILFCLLILRGLSDSKGRVWRCHPTQLYAIEVTLPEQPEQQAGQHTIPESCTLAFLNLLPSVECLSPRQAMQLMKTEREDPSKVVMDKQEFENPHYQCVYQYLRRHIGNMNLDRFSYIGNVEGTPTNCLEIILRSCGLRDPSWAEIRHFVMFLDIQLQSCEVSVFCDETFVGDVMAGLKGFVVKFMIRMSRDFATSSLHGEVVREEATEPVPAALGGGGDLEQYQIVERRQWEHSSHPYIFFNKDGMSITFVGFMVTRNGDLVDPAHGGVLEGAIMTQQLYTGLIANRVNFEEDYRKWQKGTMIEKIATVMGIEYPYDPDESYVLTVDNLIKILAIQMRFRCGIPVVIMGETGCGKTRLIRYMCDLARQGMDRNNMLIMKVHGGITESDVTKFVEKAEEEAKINRQSAMDTVIFFDEANTTDAIGLIKEIMCDRRLHGRPISQDLKFIAACNPYRKHSEEMIEKLESAGLGFYVRATETQQKLGKIPLRQLVYRVLDLPPSMRPLVYDFGQLTTRTEEDYTRQIVFDHVMKHPVLKQQQAIIPSVAKVLAWSQGYMRRREDECSFVSLRDVERAMVVFKYFFDKMDVFGPKMNEMAARIDREMEDMEEEPVLQPAFPDPITRSLLLAISVCYHARLRDREDYEKGVSTQFAAPLGLLEGAAQFRREIQCCQEVLLDSMTLGPNIARNAALRENVFMMAICIELRIPLFLVGKPGSSKSLAKSIVQASMQGTASSSELLRGFKQVHIFSYQCSQLSTPESVIEVFNTAKRFQRNQDTTKYVSVVVLDEVGLAEDSPNLPLKALHPLLEDGTEGADDKQESQFIQREKRVAFIGISNWALDPAKMNRGVMVTRGDPDTRELQLSARGICSNKEDDPVKNRLEPYFEPLAEAYKGICENQKKEFFGLRDFYCLVKMLYWMCEKSNLPPTGPQLKHAICRNFGGMESDELDTLEEFQRYIPSRDPPDLKSIPGELHSIVNPDCSSLGLIKTSLATKETSWHGENRYLLFLTENYAALEILRHYLNDVVHSAPTDSVAIGDEDGGERSLEKMEPFILFGSSFPRDKEYTQVCRNINQIKICMETGRTVILLNLENLYESLYDVLNQYYIYHGGSRYVDLGLQTHRVKCRVHDNFKLIVIAEKNTVYEKFPTPLINRLEKHFVLTSSVLTEEQQDALHDFQDWIKQFSSVSRASEGRKFTEGDAFIGYQKDTPAAVVFQATHQLEREGLAGEASHVWKENVLKRSQYLLLQTASPDALVRLEQSPLADQKEELLELYFQQQHHNSLEDFLAHHLQRNGTRGESLLMQVTTHSHLLSRDELDHVSDTLPLDQSHIHAFSLQEFDTELDFSNKVSPAFQRREGDAHNSLLVIQCDSGHLNGDLIACARYRIYDKRAEASQRHEREGCTHVLFIIHLPRQTVGSSFVGFQGEPWISTHIDDLRPTKGGAITLQEVMGVSISQLFCGKMAADKSVRIGENKISSVAENLEEMYLHDETESMQVESDHTTTVQGGFDQDEEMTVEEEERSQPPPPQPSEPSQMDTSTEGEIPHKAPEVEEPLNLTSDDAEASVRQNLQPTREVPVGQILPRMDDQQGDAGPHWPVEGSHNTQFRRLHGCIQPAAARLQDSAKNKERATKRVGILVNLIPRDPSFPLNDSTFHGVLVRHIHRLLTERDQIREDEKNWVLNEALSARKLQNGGTFQNVLARKLDNVLVPIFSEIIALVDRNYNLNRLDPKEQSSPLCRFWLAMFRNPGIMQLRYEDMVTTQGGGHREQVPGAGGRMAEEDFKCQLPFSWLVKEAVDTQWHSAKSTVGGSSRVQLRSQLCELVSQTFIGEVLGSVDEADCEQFYQYYLHDFVRSVHQCHHKQEKSKNLEYKLISEALNSLVHGPEFATIDGHDSLTRRIAALHVIYNFTRPQVLWFGQLVSHLPGTMMTLEDKVLHDDSEMILHLHAVDHALGSLEPPLNKKDSEDKEKAVLASWLNQLRLSQNAIDSILNLPSQNELANRARLKWQLIRALQMFVEHVVLKHEGMIPYLRRLQLHLKHDANFLKASTVDRVKKHLNSMDNEFKKKLKSQPKKLGSIRRNCRAFFMELVSTLCFGAHSAPEPDLIGMLINTVFTEKQETEVGTRDFTPYCETKSDEVPVIRSFLLQLLLEHNTEQVKAHLEEYFRRSQQALTRGELDQNLCLLCIQCFEDALSKEYTLKPSQERAAAILEEGYLALQRHTGHSHGEISLGYIEGVAKVRFALSVVAKLFHKHEAMGPALLHGVKEVCTDATINHVDGTGQTDTIGPILYLLKLIVRQYGFPCLAEVSTTHTWVVPPELRRADEEQKTVDPFVIYNPLYSNLRECVSGAVYGKQLQQLKESTEDLALQDVPLLLLALYEKATLSRASALPSRQLLPDVMEELNKFILECKILPKELQWMARSLIANEQGGTLAQLGVDPRQPLQHRTLGAIVVHTAAVFLCRQKVTILQPFVNMLNNPAVLVNTYLPTMSEDTLPEARRVLGGRFYECPRGHPYMVGDCGRVVVQNTCNVCGATIGGTNYNLAHDNRDARTNDTTQAGYSLGMPEGRSTAPSPERSLSPAACCLVRALMHSALLWASCNNESAMEGLTQLVKVGIRPQNLPEFFWRHLERDVELLGRVTGKSMDESAITIHLVLREILSRVPPTSDVVTTVTSLGARNAREQWENIFNQNYIQPMLQGLEQKVAEVMHSILNDDKQEHDQLFYLVYERVQVAEGSLDPHLWAYRSRITLEHLRQNLQQRNMEKKCPILHAFLQEEPNLRATQYLPDIVRLQQYLYDSFHHRLDRKEARRMTIGEFLQARKHENVRREYQEMVESLQKAWELVGDKLRDHARLKVEDKHLLPSITLDTSLEYLIPTTVGAGACTTALTDFLVLTHNNFMETCRAIVKEQKQSKPQWREHKVPITHIHGCHLLTYEQQLPSIILSHCRYSLSMGKGQDVSYDLPALEKHLLDRFIHGKPFILSDIPQVVYRKDVYTAVTFAAVRKKVEPQTSLPPRMQQEILQELRTPDRLRETLDVVDIVLGFLSSGGGKADQPLKGYVDQTLKMKRRPFSEKAREYCTLGHVLSLWETLSVELARQLTLQGQEPFDLDTMPEYLMEELATDGEENQVEALDHCLRVLDLDNLLGTLYEFIETYVKHSPSNEKEWPLVDTLEAFLEGNGLPQIKDFHKEFPETITLAQAVDVWKHIVRYQKRLGTHGTI